jgi:general secretion pathway protein F
MQELALLTRQFATLVKAGLPLMESLSTLIEQMEHARLQRVLTRVRQQVREGRSLTDALQAHPRVFSHIYVNMVRAGEESGTLETVLTRLADYCEGQVRLLRTVQSALTYPLLMVMVASAILIFLLVYVVPQVTQIFSDTGQTLPLMTRILVRCSNVLVVYWWLFLVGGTVGALGCIRILQTSQGREWYDRMVLRLPWVGRLLQRLSVARFARTLSTLLASGVPILTALDIVRHVVGNSLLRRALEEARSSVQEGESLAAPLRRSGLFPALLLQMIAVGERSGELEGMLARAAEAYDEEVATALSRFTSLLEPLTILVMGGVVLFIVLAILMPIFEINQLVH